MSVRFIADAMLGRLAKWLRLLGYDTFYKRDITDKELLRIARQHQRVILTRDTELLKQANDTCIFITSDHLKEQLREVLSIFNERGYDSPKPFSRCTFCNALLQEIAKEEIAGLVPDYVFLNNREFVRCCECGRIYWKGSHEQRIKALLGGIR